MNVITAIESIEKCLREASNYFMSSLYNHEEKEQFDQDDQTARYYVQKAFVELLVLLESLNLTETHRQVNTIYEGAKENFTESKMGLDEPYLAWSEVIRMYLDSIASVNGLRDSSTSEIRDLKSVIRRSVYAICDSNIFTNLPDKEAVVHDRIEAILKCHFLDLKRKPALTKPIKNFEPDSGIPSIKTLIEYKFVETKTDAKRVVDEILADTSGYKCPQWKNLLFVIYETRRVMPEEDWKELLLQCELGSNYDVIVLSGDAY